eukprot:scaffold2911_cov414-Prasinococcus_capsulatus_cf.AAC.47
MLPSAAAHTSREKASCSHHSVTTLWGSMRDVAATLAETFRGNPQNQSSCGWRGRHCLSGHCSE